MSKQWITRGFIVLIAFSSAAIILRSTYGHYESLSELSFQVWSPNIFLSLIPVLLMHLMKSWTHVLLLRHEGLREKPALELQASYFLSQIARYLPGKIIGIATQSLQLTGSIKGGTIWRANFTQYVLTNFYSVQLLVVLMTVYVSGNAYYIGLLGLIVVTTWIVIRSDCCVLLFNGFLTLIKRQQNSSTPQLGWGRGQVARLIILLNLDWLFYFGFWVVALHGTLTLHEALLFSSLYAAASLLSTLVVVMPSGLIIREAMFVGLGTLLGSSNDYLVIYSILTRLLFTLGDVLIFGVFWLINLAVERWTRDRTANVLEPTGPVWQIRIRN